MLLSGAAILILLKPKQEQQDLSDEKADHLTDAIKIAKSIIKDGVKDKIISNATVLSQKQIKALR